MNRLIIVGSPRTGGRSAALADALFEACIEECPEDEVFLAPVSTLSIAGCTGCDACKDAAGRGAEGAGADGSDDAAEADDAASMPCSIADDMAELYPLIDDADELIVVSPVYFAGAPSQMKALLDRLQPYFWTDAREQAKRPATLHVVGEGGDPHGFDPLVGTVRSALSVAGFRLERVLNWVGKISEDGEIVAEAEEHAVGGVPVRVIAGGAAAGAAGRPGAGGEDDAEEAGDAEAVRSAEAGEGSGAPARGPRGGEGQDRPARPRLSLGANGAERQVIALDDEGRRIDDGRHGRKRAGERRHATSKRGTGGVKPKAASGDFAKGKGGAAHGKGKQGAAGGKRPAGTGGKPGGAGKRGGQQGGRGGASKQGKRRG